MTSDPITIVGARPNLPKIAPLVRQMRGHPEIHPVLLHTGQHYDDALSEIFFRQMGIRAPDVNLGVGSGSHAAQTAAILARVEPVLLHHDPDLVLVVGDVNSTIAVSLAAVKLGIPVAAARDILAGKGKTGRLPALWDGRAAERIVDVLLQIVPSGRGG